MAVVLPYDIWCLIASYIPNAELAKLYCVNSAFFNMIMNDKYREASIYHVDDEDTRRWLRDMSPVVAKHVRSLVLRPHLLAMELPTSDERDKYSFTSRLRNRLRKAVETITPKKPFPSRILLQNISNMTEVTSLTIGCYPLDNVQLFTRPASMAFIHTAWSAHASRLRILSLSIPLEVYSAVLNAAPLVLPSLEELRIVLRTEIANPTLYQNILDSIVELINRHARTLTSLSVDTPEATVDSFPLFNRLDKFPNLDKLSVRHPLDLLHSASPTGIDSFMANHANSLRELAIRFVGTYSHYPLPSPDEMFSHPILQVQLPRLKCLDLGLCQWPRTHNKSIKHNLAKYLHPIRHTLTNLVVRDCVLTFPMIAGMVTALGDCESLLDSLEIYPYFLSCKLLDFLSQSLPRLHCLDLYFHNLSSQDDGSQYPDYSANFYGGWGGRWITPTINSGSEFLNELADRRGMYSQWALRHVILQPVYFCGGRWNECRVLLVQALPSVKTFNGVSCREFSDVPDYTNFRDT